ncbi:NAD-dependent succinate-semialdehyde dehydrogenase [Salinimonas lutimaris]|uniref:NAD-dependent succinate-semialdehyde dehydrogenase n=1 Tax=Salinimonas lutimaris TaxID=914153 RepID=UPI0010C095F1|nr:NAD-dependent succinate-semialdehyde dehydrogenase [Salinimonas lutimaris]
MQSDALQTLLKNGSYINGEWKSAQQKFDVTNPATGELVAQVADASEDDAHAAIEAADSAFKSWSKTTAAERAALLRKWFNLMTDHAETLGHLLTLEQGKPLAEAIGEVKYGAGYIEWFAEEAKRVYGDTIPGPAADKRVVVIKQPVGVVTAITPWNFPNAMITRKAAAALAAGCTFVVRPATETPLSALAMAELAHQAGIPAGVFNVVTGTQSSALGKVLTQHPRVAKFTFTGSTGVGKILLKQCADGVKKVSMELGGNAPFIVFEDADLDAAVEGLMLSKYRNAGQTCVCTNRIYVHDSVHDQFVEKFVAKVRELKIGNGLDEGVNIGPLIHQKAVQDVKQLVDDSVAQGAQIVYGGTPQEDSTFFAPTVVTGVTQQMPLAAEEIFGPVSAILRFSDESDVIAQANDSEYGLAAYFYSRDIGRVWRVSEQLEFGMVGINEGAISNPAAPFGGVKQSGSGREGSKYGLEDYLEIKYLCMGGI